MRMYVQMYMCTCRHVHVHVHVNVYVYVYDYDCVQHPLLCQLQFNFCVPRKIVNPCWNTCYTKCQRCDQLRLKHCNIPGLMLSIACQEATWSCILCLYAICIRTYVCT